MQWRGRIHVSWRLMVLSLGYVAGVALAPLFSVDLHPPVLWGLGAITSVLLPWRMALPLLAGIAIVAGLAVGGEVYGHHSRLQELVGASVTLTGTIKDDATKTDNGETRFVINNVTASDYLVTGAIWVATRQSVDVKRGDVVVVSGVLDQPFGVYAGVLSSATVEEVTRPVPGDVGRVVRDHFADAVRTAIPEPQASLGIGFLTGQKSALPTELAEAMQIAGLTHIVVASGYNLTILVRMSRRLFVKHSRFLTLFSSYTLIASFVLVTGFSPSMTRAAFVSVLSLLIWSYGRQTHPFVLISIVAAATVLMEPSFVWGDLGWLLSFSAFLGVMILAPLLQRFFFGREPPGILRQVMGETIAAHLATLPVVVTAFGALSHVAIIANVLIVPLVPIAMLGTFIVGMVALTVPSLAELVAWPVTQLLAYMTTVAETLAGLPWAQWQVQPAWWLVAGYCLVLVIACIIMQRITKYRLRETNLVL